MKKENKSVVKVKARLYDNGDFKIIPYDLKKFKRFIKKMDIVRGIFWSNHIVSKWGEKVE